MAKSVGAREDLLELAGPELMLKMLSLIGIRDRDEAAAHGYETVNLISTQERKDLLAAIQNPNSEAALRLSRYPDLPRITEHQLLGFFQVLMENPDSKLAERVVAREDFKDLNEFFLSSLIETVMRKNPQSKLAVGLIQRADFRELAGEELLRDLAREQRRNDSRLNNSLR